MTTLYARNLDKSIKEWSISKINESSAVIRYGRFNGLMIDSTIHHTSIDKEVASRIAKKRKEGYKYLIDLTDNLVIDDVTFELLDKVLPIFNTDGNWNQKPMKCQTFREKKLQYPVAGQPKLNGLRCVLKWEKTSIGDGLFAKDEYKATLRTKEGLEYVLPHITSSLSAIHFKYNDLNLVFDGELYIHGKKLNQIKASCPMINSNGTLSKASGNPTEVQFYIFDLAIETTLQKYRIETLTYLNSFNLINCNQSIFCNNDIKLVESVMIQNDYEATIFRNNCIRVGYEGCVLRTLDAEYAFGSRPSFIMKFKDHMDSEFLIIDIISKPSDPTLPLFICRNDDNDETFECNPTGAFDTQREYLINKSYYIGKYATVRYHERSGVKGVPFHANIIDIRDTNKS